MKFVVARYNENVDWTNGLNCIIYNKGPTTPNSTQPYITLPNVGREGHTYLYHIIENYDNLDDHTCFLQGNPFDHSPHLEGVIKEFFEKIEKKETVDYMMVSIHAYEINLSKDDTDTGGLLLLQDVYEKVFGQRKVDHSFRFGAGAQFIVSKETILSRSKSFYENILHLLDYSINPYEGYSIERCWHMIFTHTE